MSDYGYMCPGGYFEGPFETIEEAEEKAAKQLDRIGDTITVVRLVPVLKVVLVPKTETAEYVLDDEPQS